MTYNKKLSEAIKKLSNKRDVYKAPRASNSSAKLLKNNKPKIDTKKKIIAEAQL